MNANFTSEFFGQNRERLKTLFSGTAPIVLTANGLMQRSGDMAYPFRQDSNFWYLTGIEEPDVILVLDKNKEYLILPEREEWRDSFEGAVEKNKLAAISGINEILDEKDGWQKLSRRLKKVQHIATLAAPQPYLGHYGFYSNPARGKLISRLKETAGQDVELLDLRMHLARMRSVKQGIEIAAIQQSIDATITAIQQVFAKREDYNFEYQIESDITAHFLGQGLRHGYDPIVAAGKNTCTLHHSLNNAPIAKDDLLLLDVGAQAGYYSADITRTFAVENMSKRQQAVFNSVVEVHNYASELMKPGITYKEYEKQVSHFMGEKLRELGLIKTIDKDQVRKYFPHLTSHHLGLDIHDVHDPSRPFEPGMVLTIEPGIYIPEENIGIRIEDDVLITKTGIKNLSQKLPLALG